MENTLVGVPAQRPQEINEILGSLKRYDVLVIKDLEDYLKVQCEKNFNDVNANLALLKLYELSSESLSEEREESTINILINGLCHFYNVDFELYLHLLPVYVLNDINLIKKITPNDNSYVNFSANIGKLKELYSLLISAKFIKFWSLVKNDETYQDLIYDSFLHNDFDLNVRNSILNLIYKGYTNGDSNIKSKINVELLQNYLNLHDAKQVVEFLANHESFKISGNVVLINSDVNLIKDEENDDKENDTTHHQRSIVSSENIKFEQLGRLIKESLEK